MSRSEFQLVIWNPDWFSRLRKQWIVSNIPDSWLSNHRLILRCLWACFTKVGSFQSMDRLIALTEFQTMRNRRIDVDHFLEYPINQARGPATKVGSGNTIAAIERGKIFLSTRKNGRVIVYDHKCLNIRQISSHWLEILNPLLSIWFYNKLYLHFECIATALHWKWHSKCSS